MFVSVPAEWMHVKWQKIVSSTRSCSEVGASDVSHLAAHVRRNWPEGGLSALVVIEDVAHEAGDVQRVGLVLAIDVRQRR